MPHFWAIFVAKNPQKKCFKINNLQDPKKALKSAQKEVDLRLKIQHNTHMMQNKAQVQQVLYICNTAENRQKTVDL